MPLVVAGTWIMGPVFLDLQEPWEQGPTNFARILCPLWSGIQFALSRGEWVELAGSFWSGFFITVPCLFRLRRVYEAVHKRGYRGSVLRTLMEKLDGFYAGLEMRLRGRQNLFSIQIPMRAPFLWKELRQKLSGRFTYLVRFALALLVIGVLVATLPLDWESWTLLRMWFVYPAVLCLTVLAATHAGAASFARERQRGTLEPLLAVPIPLISLGFAPWAVLLGAALVPVAVWRPDVALLVAGVYLPCAGAMALLACLFSTGARSPARAWLLSLLVFGLHLGGSLLWRASKPWGSECAWLSPLR